MDITWDIAVSWRQLDAMFSLYYLLKVMYEKSRCFDLVSVNNAVVLV